MILARVDANTETYAALVGLRTMQITLKNTVKNRKYTKKSYIQCGRFLLKEEPEAVSHKICSQQKSMVIKKKCPFFIIIIIIIITTITTTTTMVCIRWSIAMVSQAIFIGYLRALPAKMNSQNNDCTMILQLFYFQRTHVLLTPKTHILKLHQHSPITWPRNNDVIKKSLPQATYQKHHL